jgi:hypothetical protein
MGEDEDAARFGAHPAAAGITVAGRLTRFLNLERQRPPGEEHVPVNQERFTPEEPRPPASGLQVDVEPADLQPFLRCLHCQADNTRFAETCTVCGARLHTVEQEAYNKTLWAQRQAESAAEQEALRKMHDPAVQDTQRRVGEALAQQVAEREQARLFWMNSERLPGVRLIEIIPPAWRWRLGCGVAAWLALSGYFAWTTHKGGWVWAFFGTLLGLVSLFTPPRRYRSRFFWWQGPRF